VNASPAATWSAAAPSTDGWGGMRRTVGVTWRWGVSTGYLPFKRGFQSSIRSLEFNRALKGVVKIQQGLLRQQGNFKFSRGFKGSLKFNRDFKRELKMQQGFQKGP
jgi:hypothetical protein